MVSYSSVGYFSRIFTNKFACMKFILILFQDLKTFSEDDFDPKKWINKAWSSSGNQDKEVSLHNLITSYKF